MNRFSMDASTGLSLGNSSSVLLRHGTTSEIKAQVEASRVGAGRALCDLGGRCFRVGRECAENLIFVRRSNPPPKNKSKQKCHDLFHAQSPDTGRGVHARSWRANRDVDSQASVSSVLF